VDPTESLREIREDWRRIESKLLDMERRAYRLRCALREAGVPENLVRAVELGGGEPPLEQVEVTRREPTKPRQAFRVAGLRTDDERRKAPRGGGS
jgi:hypothetical protein